MPTPATQSGQVVSFSSSSGVETQHPQYIEIAPDWQLVRDCAAGERRVKSKTTIYLSTTSGMRAAGVSNANQEGTKMYAAYLKRAVFPYMVQPAVNALVGVMHREEAIIELPPQMEPLRDNATLDGEDLNTLLRRINEAQLLTGRIGLMADVPGKDPGALPYIVTYEAESIINWDCSRRRDGRLRLDLVVLDETAFERTSTFGWEKVKKHLVLDLVEPADLSQNAIGSLPLPPEQTSVYRSRLEIDREQNKPAERVNRDTEVVSEDAGSIMGVTPKYRGSTLEEIPFVFVGSIDLTPSPDQIPMLGLSELSMTIYRGEADYRHTLFMQGQDTLVTMGDTKEENEKKDRFIGASASIDLPKDGDAKFIGVSSDGLSEQREALQNDRRQASELGANLLTSTGAQKEAQESLQIRVAARTASITSVVKAGAQGLQTVLRVIAVWMNLDPKKVTVTPNMDFVPDQFVPKDLVDFMTAKGQDAPIALESVHRWLVEKGVTEMTFEEEMKTIEEETEKFNQEPEQTPEEKAALETMLANARMQQQGGNLPPGQQPPGNLPPGQQPPNKEEPDPDEDDE